MSETNGGFVAGTIEEWKGRREFPATLPSGMNVVLRTVTLDELSAEEGLPDDLLRVAMIEKRPLGVSGEIGRQLDSGDGGEQRAKKVSQDLVELRDRLVLRAVVRPALTPEDVAELDGFDKAMIADIASRQIGEDAAGRQVYGNPNLATFREADPVG